MAKDSEAPAAPAAVSRATRRNRRKVTSVERWTVDVPPRGEDGKLKPGVRHYLLIYVHDDESARTVEFDCLGKHVAEYEGEPADMAGLTLATATE